MPLLLEAEVVTPECSTVVALRKHRSGVVDVEAYPEGDESASFPIIRIYPSGEIRKLVDREDTDYFFQRCPDGKVVID